MLARLIIRFFAEALQQRREKTVFANRPHFERVLKRLADGARRIGVRHGCEYSHRVFDVRDAAKRRSRAQLHHDVGRVIFVFAQPLQGVLKHRQIGGVVPRDFFGTHERNLRAEVARDPRDFFVVGRNQNARHARRRLRRRDAVRDQRKTAEFQHVFARDAFAAAARRNDRQNFRRFFRRVFASTRGCVGAPNAAANAASSFTMGSPPSSIECGVKSRVFCGEWPREKIIKRALF